MWTFMRTGYAYLQACLKFSLSNPDWHNILVSKNSIWFIIVKSGQGHSKNVGITNKIRPKISQINDVFCHSHSQLKILRANKKFKWVYGAYSQCNNSKREQLSVHTIPWTFFQNSWPFSNSQTFFISINIFQINQVFSHLWTFFQIRELFKIHKLFQIHHFLNLWTFFQVHAPFSKFETFYKFGHFFHIMNVLWNLLIF